jgi:hypothetical protein
MLFLQSHHIVDVYVWVGDQLPEQTYPKGGRPPCLSNNELITLLLWNVLALRQKTIKDIHTFTRLHLEKEFPQLSKYNAFLEHCHRVLPQMIFLLSDLMQDEDALRFVDSTMLPVCRNHRADSHKVAKKLASFGKKPSRVALWFQTTYNDKYQGTAL